MKVIFTVVTVALVSLMGSKLFADEEPEAVVYCSETVTENCVIIE